LTNFVLALGPGLKESIFLLSKINTPDSPNLVGAVRNYGILITGFFWTQMIIRDFIYTIATTTTHSSLSNTLH
jgi:hypothetical protein